MKSVLMALEDVQYSWHLDADTYLDFRQVAEEVGCNFDKYKTKEIVKNHIIEKIRVILEGNEITSYEFSKIEDHFSLKYYTYKSKDDKDVLDFLQKLKQISSIKGQLTNNVDSWLKSKELLQKYLQLEKDYFNFDNGIIKKLQVVSESIKYLNNKGFKVDIVDGSAVLDESSEEKVLNAITYRIGQSGNVAIKVILENISNHYNIYQRRYFMRPEPPTIQDFTAETPWGYLFNLSLAFYNKPSKQRRVEKKIDEAIEISRKYFTIMQLQEENKFSDASIDGSSILSAIQKNILYDQHYSIDQIAISHFNEIIEGLFSNNLSLPIGFNCSLYLDILKLVSSANLDEYPLSFTAKEIYVKLGYRYAEGIVKKALLDLSMSSKKINKGYKNPFDINKRNYYQKPFILDRTTFTYINPLFNSYGFYEVLSKLLLSTGQNHNLLGSVSESLVEKMFDSNNISYLSNKKYKINRSLNISSQEGECDFIIETKETIFFIELKRKTLTTKAREGDQLHGILDITLSFIHAISQAGRHELVLRKQGFIKFKDDTELTLNNRNIERVALSLFDFYSMHDNMFTTQILSNLISSKIQSEDTKTDKKINKYIGLIREQYNSEEFRSIYGQDNLKFLNCRFFSVPQLLVVLNNASNNEKFCEEMAHTRNISTGCKDWYKDNHFIRRLKQGSLN